MYAYTKSRVGKKRCMQTRRVEQERSGVGRHEEYGRIGTLYAGTKLKWAPRDVYCLRDNGSGSRSVGSGLNRDCRLDMFGK